jgi:hypothetical protein
MSYNSIAASAGDYALQRRIASCAAQEGAPGDPMTWALTNIWSIVSEPEIENPYEYAMGQENPNPGGDEGVITDAVLLAHIQPMIIGTPPPE